ncbi:MAG: mechanosensitive ion channel family protein [Nitrospiraceae bacterium]|nr:mechanosensitive ion channel family protein [Nitrospiraceae bacterium]
MRFEGFWIAPAAIAIGVAAVLFMARSLLLRMLRKWALRRNKDLHDLFLESLRFPSLFWCIAIGIYEGIDFSGVPGKYAVPLDKTVYVLLLISVTIVAANLTTRLLGHYVRKADIPIPTTGLTYNLIKALVYVIGFLIILHDLGVSILPLLTALGVGGLAVALALQDTLSNLFAGLQILIEKPVRLGDYVKLDSGQEGYIKDIGLRTTRLSLLNGNMLVIPNNKITQSIITNYYMPDPRTAFSLAFQFPPQADAGQIEKILLEEAEKASGDLPDLLREPPPSVTFSALGPVSIELTLNFRLSEFTTRYAVQHELRKRIYKRLRDEKVY